MRQIPIDYKKTKEIREKAKSMLGESWGELLWPELSKDYFKQLGKFIALRSKQVVVYPNKEDMFKAFKLTPYENVRAVIVGQDPYNNGCSDGLAFSRKAGTPYPASLQVIMKAVSQQIPASFNPRSLDGYLDTWAEQGILLLNTVLTVERGAPRSHAGKGWETFTGQAIHELNARKEPIAFVLWGGDAKKVRHLINTKKHPVLVAEHPAAPLYAGREWKSNDTFSKLDRFFSNVYNYKFDW